MPTAFHKDVRFLASPNFSTRNGRDVDGIVMHHTGGIHSAGWMQQAVAKASAHFLIDRDGTITQMVDLKMAAWHAGSSCMEYKGRMSQNPNLFTIGIELENMGMVLKHGDKFVVEIGNHLADYTCPGTPVQGDMHFSDGHAITGYWEPFYEPQLEKMTWLIDELEKVYPNIKKNIVGHCEIAVPMGRKVDPSPAFDWSLLGRNNATMKVKYNLARMTPNV